MRHDPGDAQRADRESSGSVVLACHGVWRHESESEMYDRIIRELAYDPDDVYEIRVTEAAIEVDFVDFENVDWPVVTRRHLQLRPGAVSPFPRARC